MQLIRTFSRIAAAVLLTLGATLGFAGVATATPEQPTDVYGCSENYITGSGGHKGVSITCVGDRGDSFRAVAVCKKLGGETYTHYGPWVFAYETSTVWCDLGARVSNAWAQSA
ncbi:hypothetical protein SAMN04487905_11199 [Actinopolyspora xinjiangensis]|uniref:Secreted protein n=1 Tax=Actinopolyspora xinjiangensis TaxID=405564 RepID=A0A1H0W9J7_9ACTN|nr:hypothetical protein [Actinopolyspora xinjiangensis]SDP87404.1 hypothetical protein SAMN04487905_11199 [Actinopolyspora xinjiangensis]